MKRYGALFIGWALMLALAGCSESDVIALRIQLKGDFSGTVSVCSLALPPEGGPLERKSSGVEWSTRMSLVCSAGAFPNLSRLRVEDVKFLGGSTPDGLNYLQVTLPRGPAAQWVKTMVPLARPEREKAALAFDPGGRIKDIGAAVKLRIDLPGLVVGHGVTAGARGVDETADKQRAELLVPVDLAQKPGEAIQWHLTWQTAMVEKRR